MNKYLITFTSEWGYTEQYVAIATCPYKTLRSCWDSLDNIWVYYDLYTIAKDQYGYDRDEDVLLHHHSKFTIVPFNEKADLEFEEYILIYDQSDDLPF